MRGQKLDVEELLRQSQAELLWIQRQLSIIAARNASHARAKEKVNLTHTNMMLYSTQIHPQNKPKLAKTVFSECPIIKYLNYLRTSTMNLQSLRGRTCLKLSLKILSDIL